MSTTLKSSMLPSGERGQVSLDPLTSLTLPSRYYYDEGIYRQEMAQIHRKSWTYIGHVSEVSTAGRYFTDTVAEQPIVVVRGSDDVLRCFFNVCSHRGHKLLEGAGQLKSKGIMCPYHAWIYHLDGRLGNARLTEAVKDFDKAQFGLKQINIAVAAGLIFVNLDQNCAAFDEEMAGFAENIETFLPTANKFIVAERLHYDIKANWKTVVDNFSEAYHIPVCHPQLARVLEQEMEELKAERRWTFNRFKSKEGFPGFEIEKNSPYYAWQAWPHFCALSLPGSNNLIVLRMAPDGVGSCAERVDIYTPEGETDNPKLHAVRDLFMHMFNVEDIAIVESVQQGLQSMGYDQGRYICDPNDSWFTEFQLHWLHMQVLEALAQEAQE